MFVQEAPHLPPLRALVNLFFVFLGRTNRRKGRKDRAMQHVRFHVTESCMEIWGLRHLAALTDRRVATSKKRVEVERGFEIQSTPPTLAVRDVSHDWTSEVLVDCALIRQLVDWLPADLGHTCFSAVGQGCQPCAR